MIAPPNHRAAGQPPAKHGTRPRLGVDAYSLRTSGWDACTTLEYCADLGAEVVHFSEPRFLGPLDDANVDRARARADALGLELEVGMGSICPTSTMFRGAEGTAVEQLTRMLFVAKRMRSPIVRCYFGSLRIGGRSWPGTSTRRSPHAARSKRSPWSSGS